MTQDKIALIEALRPLVARVRTDVTAVKNAGGAQVWTSEPLTDERLARHVNGGPARGVAPIKPGESVTMVALLDFDSHKGETGWDEMAATAAKVHAALDLAWGCNPVAFRSSGGRGIHLFLLWAEPQDARSVRLWLASLLGDCGLKPGTGGVGRGEVEIFPRQNSVRPGGFGNQFILPLAGRGALLAYEDLADTLVPAADAGVAPSPAMWRDSPPVPAAPPAAPASSTRPAAVGNLSEAELALVWGALDAIPNDGERSLTYDEWMRVGFAVHWATSGSAEGLERVEAWSARSPKHVPGYLQEKVWELADRNAGMRDTVITAAYLFDLAERYGWRHPARNYPDPGDFPALPAVEARAPAAPAGEGADGADPFARPAGERRGVPAAKHLTTDQANANRIVQTYGTRVLVAADRWHVWDGARWAADEAGVYRYACHLSAIVKDESKAWESKNSDVAQALKKWGARCEMKGTIEAAVGLARKMLTVDVETLDADPWLLNVRNGVVDLRTGRLGKHDPSLMMTKVAGADYLGLDAPSSGMWERTVLEIVGGDVGVANFLRRWFGYCCTGLTQEQVFVVHWGDGANGKSTVLETIARVLGDYAATAASSLLVGDHSERAGAASPEVAALRGRRMVTAHETGEGMRLREAFVKQATGSDRISARHLYGEPFSFLPTHKIQLLTNSKPTVRGQDHGIWRRVRLVPYTQRFGSAEDVAAKRATRVRDLGMAEALGTEQVLSEVLAWLVRGAVEWHTSGLHEPAVVVEASEAYRLEQDRVLQFLRECCELDTAGDKDWSEPLTQGMVGLYPAYVSWTKDAGGHALSRQKFLAEVQRAHPRAETFDSWGKGESGGRRKVVRVRAVRLLAE